MANSVWGALLLGVISLAACGGGAFNSPSNAGGSTGFGFRPGGRGGDAATTGPDTNATGGDTTGADPNTGTGGDGSGTDPGFPMGIGGRIHATHGIGGRIVGTVGTGGDGLGHPGTGGNGSSGSTGGGSTGGASASGGTTGGAGASGGTTGGGEATGGASGKGGAAVCCADAPVCDPGDTEASSSVCSSEAACYQRARCCTTIWCLRASDAGATDAASD